MRNATFCSLVVLVGSWSSSVGQSAPNVTFPRVVAKFARMAQTGEISPTIIYTPKNWGTFRISLIMVLTVGNGNQGSTWNGVTRFTNGGGKFAEPSLSLSTTIRTSGAVETPLRAKAGVPITVEVTSSGDTQNSKYNIWVVVEQLM
jgi:hypothetical protein